MPCHFLEGLASQIVSHILRMWRLNRPGYRLSWNHIVVGIATPKILNFLFMHLHRLSITCTTRHRMTSHGCKDSTHERPFGVAGGRHAWQGACMAGGVWQGVHACWGVFVAREQIDRRKLRLRAVIYLFPFTKRTNTRFSLKSA